MGTKTTSIPTPGSFGNQAGTGQWNDDQAYTMPEDGWIDKVHFYAGGNGSTQNFTCGVYRTDTGALLASTTTSGFNGKAWKSLGFSLNNTNNNFPGGGYNAPNLYLWSGYAWSVGWWCAGNADCGINSGVGGFYFTGGGSGPASTRAHGSLNPFGNAGSLYYYLEYFPPAQVTGIPSTPVAPGTQFVVTGLSFTSGIQSVTVGGVACGSVTVNSDTQITVTAPSQGCQGQVTVNTNAGTATSSGTMIVGQIDYGDASGSGAVHSILAVKYGDASGSGVVHTAAGIWVPNGAGVKRVW